MANHRGGLEDFLDFMSTPAWRSAILLAAIAFAACHILAVATPPLDASGKEGVAGPQLVHLCAVLLRFALPLACLIAGVVSFAARKRAALQPARSRP